MRGEFAIDLDRPPVIRSPDLEGLPKLLPFLLADAEQGAVAIGSQADIARAIEFETMTAREMGEPAAIEVDILGTFAQSRDHRIERQIGHGILLAPRRAPTGAAWRGSVRVILTHPPKAAIFR